MRADHLFAGILVLLLQFVVVAVGGSSTSAVVAVSCVLIALFLAVPGYIWALQGAPLGLKTSRPWVKSAVVGLVAFALSCLGLLFSVLVVAGRVRVK